MTRILAALVRPTLYAFNPVTSTRAFSAKSGSRDHYQTLGVNQNATHAQIKSAFDEYTVVFNQEKKTGNPDVYKKYREIEAAYNILSDYESRRLYNKGLLAKERRSYIVYFNLIIFVRISIQCYGTT